MPEANNISPDQLIPDARITDHKASFDVLDEKNQDAWDYHQSNGRRMPRLATSYTGPERRSGEDRRYTQSRSYSGPERRARTLLIDSKIAPAISTEHVTGGQNEAEQLINEFPDWVPTSLAEGKAVLAGPQKRVNIAENTKVGDGESAALKRIREYQGYLLDSAHGLDVLQQVMKNPEDSNSSPDPNLFRSSHEAQEVIINQLTSRIFLLEKYKDKWPSKNSSAYQEKEKYWRGFITEVVKSASDEGINYLVQTFYDRATKRYKYWLKEYARVERMPITQSLIEQGRLMPITTGQLLGEKYQREWQEEVPEPKADRPTIDFEAMVPQKARAEIAAAKAEEKARLEAANRDFDLQWDKLAEMFPPQVVIEKLAISGLKRVLTSAEQFAAADQAWHDDVSRRAHNQPSKKVRQGSSSRKTKTVPAWLRRLSGYDKQGDPSNPRPI